MLITIIGVTFFITRIRIALPRRDRLGLFTLELLIVRISRVVSIFEIRD